MVYPIFLIWWLGLSGIAFVSSNLPQQLLYYRSYTGETYGPFPEEEVYNWYMGGLLPEDTPIAVESAPFDFYPIQQLYGSHNFGNQGSSHGNNHEYWTDNFENRAVDAAKPRSGPNYESENEYGQYNQYPNQSRKKSKLFDKISSMAKKVPLGGMKDKMLSLTSKVPFLGNKRSIAPVGEPKEQKPLSGQRNTDDSESDDNDDEFPRNIDPKAESLKSQSSGGEHRHHPPNPVDKKQQSLSQQGMTRESVRSSKAPIGQLAKTGKANMPSASMAKSATRPPPAKNFEQKEVKVSLKGLSNDYVNSIWDSAESSSLDRRDYQLNMKLPLHKFIKALKQWITRFLGTVTHLLPRLVPAPVLNYGVCLPSILRYGGFEFFVLIPIVASFVPMLLLFGLVWLPDVLRDSQIVSEFASSVGDIREFVSPEILDDKTSGASGITTLLSNLLNSFMKAVTNNQLTTALHLANQRHPVVTACAVGATVVVVLQLGLLPLLTSRVLARLDLLDQQQAITPEALLRDHPVLRGASREANHSRRRAQLRTVLHSLGLARSLCVALVAAVVAMLAQRGLSGLSSSNGQSQSRGLWEAWQPALPFVVVLGLGLLEAMLSIRGSGMRSPQMKSTNRMSYHKAILQKRIDWIKYLSDLSCGAIGEGEIGRLNLGPYLADLLEDEYEWLSTLEGNVKEFMGDLANQIDTSITFAQVIRRSLSGAAIAVLSIHSYMWWKGVSSSGEGSNPGINLAREAWDRFFSEFSLLSAMKHESIPPAVAVAVTAGLEALAAAWHRIVGLITEVLPTAAVAATLLNPQSSSVPLPSAAAILSAAAEHPLWAALIPVFLWAVILGDINVLSEEAPRLSPLTAGDDTFPATQHHLPFKPADPSRQVGSGWTTDGPDKSLGVLISGGTLRRNGATKISDIDLHLDAGKITVLVGDMQQSGISEVLGLVWRDPSVVSSSESALRCQVHGRDAKDWNIEALRKRMTFLRFSEPKLSLHSGAMAGWVPSSSQSEIDRHLTASHITGADRIISNLPGGPGCMLTTMDSNDPDSSDSDDDPHSNGVSLSESEWRTLAVCRCLTHIDRDVVMLENPTDVLTDEQEYAFFEYLRSVIRRDQVIVVTTAKRNLEVFGDKVYYFRDGAVFTSAGEELFPLEVDAEDTERDSDLRRNSQLPGGRDDEVDPEANVGDQIDRSREGNLASAATTGGERPVPQQQQQEAQYQYLPQEQQQQQQQQQPYLPQQQQHQGHWGSTNSYPSASSPSPDSISNYPNRDPWGQQSLGRAVPTSGTGIPAAATVAEGYQADIGMKPENVIWGTSEANALDGRGFQGGSDYKSMNSLETHRQWSDTTFPPRT